jgi:hypothetical protein
MQAQNLRLHRQALPLQAAPGNASANLADAFRRPYIRLGAMLAVRKKLLLLPVNLRSGLERQAEAYLANFATHVTRRELCNESIPRACTRPRTRGIPY